MKRPAVITASGPILVAQYEHSVGPMGNGNNFGLGDPFMMLIPPELQYDTSYAFQSVPHPEFVSHYVNVVVPTADTLSLYIDSVRIDSVTGATPFRAIQGTIYSYTQVLLSAGAHTAYADAPFGLYSYGYGRANSYGYPGGAIYRILVHDFQHPYIRTLRECRGVNGVAIDDRITDSGIDSCYVVPSGTRNVNVNIETFTPGTDSVLYAATLENPYQDGSVEIKAVDSGGRSIIQRNAIAGFTLGIRELDGDAPTRVSGVSYNGDRVCRDVQIVNYGSFDQTISNLALTPDNGQFTVTTPIPIVIKPGEQQVVQICYENYLDSTIEGRLTIGGLLHESGNC